MKAILALEDGTIYKGESFGASGERFGEVVFNTSMTGYQEILTDPSYKGQMVTMTYPLIGNYGVNEEDVESCKPFAEGFMTSAGYYLGRPVDVQQYVDGSILVSDDKAGAIYRISYQK